MNKPKVAIVRGKFLNRFEMQFFEPLTKRFDMMAFGSLTPFHDQFAFPVIKLPSPMDLPAFRFKMPMLNRMFIDAHYLFGLEAKLRGFDLVHTAETYFRYTQQALNAKKRGYVKKVIATVLETIPFNNEGIWGRKTYKARARAELDHIIALTYKSKDSLIAEGADPGKITVIGHFIDTKRFRPEKQVRRKNPFTVLFVGRLEEYKGVSDLVEAAKVLLNERPQLRFLFVGDGSQKSCIPNDPHFVQKKLAYDEMPDVYRDADIFVAPSKPRIARVLGKLTWEEQYCTALLEAQASGLPIITTSSGGIPENVGDAAVVIEPGDVRALTVAINDLLVHPMKRMKLAKRARERALAVHDARIGAKKIADLYDRVLAV